MRTSKGVGRRRTGWSGAGRRRRGMRRMTWPPPSRAPPPARAQFPRIEHQASHPSLLSPQRSPRPRPRPRQRLSSAVASLHPVERGPPAPPTRCRSPTARPARGTCVASASSPLTGPSRGRRDGDGRVTCLVRVTSRCGAGRPLGRSQPPYRCEGEDMATAVTLALPECARTKMAGMHAHTGTLAPMRRPEGRQRRGEGVSYMTERLIRRGETQRGRCGRGGAA